MAPGPWNALLVERANTLVLKLKDNALMLVTAESCTGGLLSALITEIPGSSDVFDRGFITYSNKAKEEMLGVSPTLIENLGAVSAEVASAMAAGALERSGADIALSITGIAGPGGGTPGKPVGLVHFGGCRATKSGATRRSLALERRFGDIGRDQVRFEAVRTALDMIDDLI